ncbi:unnamed protein product [Heligmosomoides polygyrus]|uniref:Uncharacterized protein n=1 Tax=Heligmosomoides polygyrus TaxID=6339 RepID=A0A183FSI4_HELPZ|nr:unnamed protein product [Heligmosomoides polygyrus]
MERGTACALGVRTRGPLSSGGSAQKDEQLHCCRASNRGKTVWTLDDVPRSAAENWVTGVKERERRGLPPRTARRSQGNNFYAVELNHLHI